MTMDTLTAEQKNSILLYREKWRNLALSTDKIERKKATEAVNSAYQIIGIKPSKTVSFDSPYAALVTVAPILESQLKNPIFKKLKIELGSQLIEQLKSQVAGKIYKKLTSKLKTELNKQLANQLRNQLKN